MKMIQQYNVKIKTTYNDQVMADNTLRLDFDTMERTAIQFEIIEDDNTAIDSTFFEDIEWVIFENYIRVDQDDYTGGRKAEIHLYKDQAGAHDSPSYIEIQAIHPFQGVMDTVRLELVATPKITKTDWVDLETLQNCTETKFNTIVGIDLDGEGIYAIPLTIDVYLTENDQHIDSLTAHKDRSLHQIHLKKEWHTRHRIFFSVVKQVYFVVTYLGHDGIKTIYNGKQQGNLLTVDGMQIGSGPKMPDTGIMPVVVGTREQYYTQRYEPCKYQSIAYTFADQPQVTIFEESDQPTDTPHRQPNITVQVGAHKKPLVIEVAGHTPQTKCSAVERGEQAHTPRIINTEEIPTKYIDTYEGNTLSFIPYFPYKYIDDQGLIPQNNYLNFLLEYFIPPETEQLVIPVETCRYTKNINVAINPDIAWAFHFRCALSSDQLEKKPDQLEVMDRKEMYFREIEDIKLHIGLNKLIEKHRNIIENIGSHFILTNLPSAGPIKVTKKFIMSLVVDYVKNIGACFGMGLHTYYNEENENTRQIASYTQRYPEITNLLISSPVALIISIEILILIFSGGSSAAARFGFNISSKMARQAAKIRKYLDTFQWVERKNEHGAFHIAWPVISLSLGKGYRAHPDGSSGYHYEIKCTATPIFGLIFRSENTIGGLLVDNSPIGVGFDIARLATSMVGKVLKLKRYSKNAKLAKRVFELQRKQGASKLKTVVATRAALHKGSKNKAFITPGSVIGILNKAEDNIKSKVDTIVKEMGLEFNFYFSVEGVYSAKFEVDINLDDPNVPQLTMQNHLPDGTYTSYSRDSVDSKGNKTNEVAYSRKKSINAYAYLAINHDLMFMTNWIAPYVPEWLGVTEEEFKTEVAQTTVAGKAMLKGGIAFEIKYGCDTHKGPYMQEFTHFSGISGSYRLKVKKRKYENEEIKKPGNQPTVASPKIEKELPMVEFILMKPYTLGGKKEYLFTQKGITDALKYSRKNTLKII
ncbi:hypothetical protein [Aquimarina aquimarini]|uniref:hypothetical protein n=1 Tax=Aquimarina aquimarini TaxID=1191734 RepID=UPI000D55E507|nr:hypothetical protein [Aquimarina aquimarini]